MVVDWDAHHGNGTQDALWTDPRVLYVSMHQWPLYPGTGRLTETGEGRGAGLTVNLPLPPGATGDVYRAAFDEVVAPVAAAFDPGRVLVSAGFDAHRACPLTNLGWSAGDYADLGRRSVALAPRGRCVGALAGVGHRPEPATTGGPGHEVAAAAARLRA